MELNEISAAATLLTDVKLPYVLEPGKIHNLKADAFIVNPKGGDAHSFVFVPQVAWAISRAMLG
jgi:hypothetical protein